MIATSVFAVLLIVHGIAHLVGFVVPWGLMTAPDLVNRTTVLGGAVEVGTSGMKFFGLIWLALAAGFVAAGGSLLTGGSTGGWIPGLAVASFLLCIIGWPDTRAGLLVNALIIVILLSVPIVRGVRI